MNRPVNIVPSAPAEHYDRREHRRRHSFTLIELLVVIAIIALLVGLVLPSLGAAREQAYFVTCAANMQQIGLGVHMFAGDYDDELVHGPDISHGFFGAFGFGLTYKHIADSQIWIGPHGLKNGYGILLDQYLDSSQAMYCPDDNTVDPVEELRKIQTAQDAYGSYIYRNLDAIEEGKHKITDLKNTSRQPAHALAFDRQTIIPNNPFLTNAYRTNHGNKQSNILFVDGHVRGFTNQDKNLFVIRAQDMQNMPGRLDQIMLNGDHAGSGGGNPYPHP